MIEKIEERKDWQTGQTRYVAWLANMGSDGATPEEAIRARLLAEAKSRQTIHHYTERAPWRASARAGHPCAEAPTSVERAIRRLASDERYLLASAARDAGGCVETIDGQDLWLPTPAAWHADDGNAEIEIPGAEDGEAAAREYVQGGDWGDRTETGWVEVRAWRVAYDEWGDEVEADSEWHTVEIAAAEPACSSEEHEWESPLEVVGGIEENPGVWGHGGGVIITEVCRHCGTYRITDTWAQGASGEQGLTSVSYREADDASAAWVESLRDGDEAEEEE